MYVILRILKQMALVDFVTLPTYSLEQCALFEMNIFIFVLTNLAPLPHT